jgi:hypothetical protein
MDRIYLQEKEIIKLLVKFFELFASFPCTRNRNRIPNTVPVPVPKSPNEYSSYGSDRFWFRFWLRNPGFRANIWNSDQG